MSPTEVSSDNFLKINLSHHWKNVVLTQPFFLTYAIALMTNDKSLDDG